MRREFGEAETIMERSSWRAQVTEQEEMRMKRRRWAQRRVVT